MKKLIILTALAISSCGAPVYQNYVPHRVHRRNIPIYGSNQRVVDKYGHIFIIDSVQHERASNQVFYAAHSENGIKYNYLPQVMIHAL